MANRKAKAQLKDIIVGEVSLVDRPANEAPFLVKKAEGDAPAPAPAPAAAGEQAAAEEKADPMIGTDVKQPLIDELGACLEALSGLAATISETQTQDGAGVPPEFTEMIRNEGARLTALADKFAPAAPPEEAPKEPAAPAAPDGPSPQTAPVDAAAIERAMENVLERYGVKKPDEASAAKSVETTKSITEKLDKVIALQQASLARAVAGSIGKSAQPPNSEPPDAPPPPAPEKRVHWPSDLSAEVTAKMAATRAGS